MGSNVRSIDMQFTQVAYGGCWKCPQDCQRCSASTPCLAASQQGFVHSFVTGIGLVTFLHLIIAMVFSLPLSWGASLSRIGISHAVLRKNIAGTCAPHLLYRDVFRGSARLY